MRNEEGRGKNEKKTRKKRGRKFSPAIDALLLLAQRAGTRRSGRGGWGGIPYQKWMQGVTDG